MSLRALAYVSALYDLLLALPLLLAPTAAAALFGAPPPQPEVNAQINGVFALALAAGYLWAARAPEERRGYFWIAGVLAKGLGAGLFVIDHVTRQSPASFLAFAVTDGALATWTLAVLTTTRPARCSSLRPEVGAARLSHDCEANGILVQRTVLGPRARRVLRAADLVGDAVTLAPTGQETTEDATARGSSATASTPPRGRPADDAPDDP